MDLLTGSALLTLRIVGAGWFWSQWSTKSDGFIDRCGNVVIIGVLLNLLPALVVSLLGIWTPLVDWSLWALIVAIGAAWSLSRHSKVHNQLVAGGGAFALVGVLLAVAVALPLRSEWLAGGWDPGIYQNNAVSIAQRNGIGPLKDSIYAALKVHERELFSIAEGSYREVFPGVPIRMEDGFLPVYFFHLTSVCGAWLYRLGGLELLNRMPVVFAFLGLLPAYVMFGALGLHGVSRGAGVLFWCLSPLWWYHQAIPTSEMLQLFLFCSAIFLYAQAMEAGRTLPIFIALALFAGTANRFDFPVFAGLLLMIAAWGETLAGNPGRMRRIYLCFTALALGIIWDLVFAQVTISRLQEKDHVLWVVLVPFALTALAGFFLVRRPFSPSMEHTVHKSLRIVGAVCALGGMALIAGLSMEATRDIWFKMFGDTPVIGGFVLRFYRLLSFHGPGLFFAVAFGAFLMASHGQKQYAKLTFVVFGLGVIVFALLLHGGIAALYPWALRRYFVYLVPFMALILSYLTLRLFEKWENGRRVWVFIVGTLVVFALVDGIRHSRDAFRVGDYKGMSAFIAFLNDHIQDGDVVVADDPRWGTPLLLVHGRDMLNGKLLWESRSAEYRSDYLHVLNRILDQGQRRVLWLTSTPSATDIYKTEFISMQPLLEGLVFHYPTVIHSNRAGAFSQRTNTATFGLYLWGGQAPGPETGGSMTTRPGAGYLASRMDIR